MTPTIIPCGAIVLELWVPLDGPVPPPGPEVPDELIAQVERELAEPEPCLVVDATVVRAAMRAGVSIDEAIRMGEHR